MNHKYGTTREAQTTYDEYEALKAKKNLTDYQIGLHASLNYWWQTYVILPWMGWLLAKSIWSGEAISDIMLVSGTIVLLLAFIIFYFKPRHQLAQLKKKCEQLQVEGELVEIKADLMSLFRERCREAKLTYDEEDRILDEFPDLLAHMVTAQQYIIRSETTIKDPNERRGYINKIRTDLIKRIDDIVVPWVQVRQTQEFLEEDALKREIDLTYGDDA